jgi:hypothetical protein
LFIVSVVLSTVLLVAPSREYNISKLGVPAS